jgi:hypothetical protein
MSEKSESKLYEMAVRGSDFRDEYEFELYGEEVTAIIKPLVDNEFLPIAAFLKKHLDLGDEAEQEEVVSEAVDKVEEAAEEQENGVDVSKLDEEVVATLQQAAKYGLHGSYDDDGNEVEFDDERKEFIVSELRGGYSVELGAKVLDISGDVRDAERFRGARGSVADSRDS